MQENFKLAEYFEKLNLDHKVVKILEEAVEESKEDLPVMMKELLSSSCNKIISPLKESCSLSKKFCNREKNNKKYKENESYIKELIN